LTSLKFQTKSANININLVIQLSLIQIIFLSLWHKTKQVWYRQNCQNWLNLVLLMLIL